jgi:predicted lipoprotein with Yx(FWY)xxD motif
MYGRLRGHRWPARRAAFAGRAVRDHRRKRRRAAQDDAHPGVPRLAAGVTLPGRLGTITRPGGAVQASYDGHPLYTFAGDFGPGDVGGNGVVQFGGTWHAVRPR